MPSGDKQKRVCGQSVDNVIDGREEEEITVEEQNGDATSFKNPCDYSSF